MLQTKLRLVLPNRLQLLQASLMLQVPVQQLLHLYPAELLRLQPLRRLPGVLLMPQRLQAKLRLFRLAMLQLRGVRLPHLLRLLQVLQVFEPVRGLLLLQAVLQVPVVVLQGAAVLLQVPVLVLRGGRRKQLLLLEAELLLLEAVLQRPEAVMPRVLVRVRLVVQEVYRRVSMFRVPESVLCHRMLVLKLN